MVPAPCNKGDFVSHVACFLMALLKKSDVFHYWWKRIFPMGCNSFVNMHSRPAQNSFLDQHTQGQEIHPELKTKLGSKHFMTFTLLQSRHQNLYWRFTTTL